MSPSPWMAVSQETLPRPSTKQHEHRNEKQRHLEEARIHLLSKPE